jgi:hypothetical protein
MQVQRHLLARLCAVRLLMRVSIRHFTVTMKWNQVMKIRKLTKSSMAFVLCAVSLAFVASARADAIVHSEGGIAFVSGGVGTDSIDRLNSLASDFDLKLVFALESGAYLSKVTVVIADAQGKPLLDTVSEGPWLLASLPTGSYRIVATFAGNSLTRQVSVVYAKLETIDFRWASE